MDCGSSFGAAGAVRDASGSRSQPSMLRPATGADLGWIAVIAPGLRQIRAILCACQFRRGTPAFATTTTEHCELWLAFGNLDQLAQLRARQRRRDVFERDGVRHDVVEP